MQGKKIEFNPRSIIDEARKYYKKLDDDEVDFDNDVRLTRSFNLVKEAYASRNAKKTVSSYELVLLWAAFNNLYSDSVKHQNSLKSKHSEQTAFHDFIKQIIKSDKKVSERKPLEGPTRQLQGPWVPSILHVCHDDCVTVAKCQWSYPRSMGDGWEKESKRLLAHLLKQEQKKQSSGTLSLTKVVSCIYYLRNLMVHGQFDPGSPFLHDQMMSAGSIMRAVLALSFQVMLEHLSRKWGPVYFGKMDDKPYVPELD